MWQCTSSFFLSPPLALTDIFNYVNYGRMEIVHHLNPYTTIPILEPHNDPSYALSNWHQLLSPYGPLFTTAHVRSSCHSAWPPPSGCSRACSRSPSLATLLLVWKSRALLGRDPVRAIVLVGLNPIVLVWGLGGDHNDFLMMFLVVLGFYLLLRARQRDHEQLSEDGVDGPFAPAPPPTLPASLADVRAAVAEVPLRERLREWLLPLSWPEIGAGAAFVSAVAVKASGAVLIPVVLAGLLRMPRRLAQVLLGMAVTTAVIAAASLIAFGLHFPDLSTQSRLITSVSVPNLIGLALGQGGETDWLHTLLSATLIVAVALCCAQAWRRRSALTAAGWSSVALLVTLSWVLPWYVLWVLPMAALSSSVRLRRTALVLGAYLIIAWAPASGQLWNAIRFHPEKTSLGRLHQRYVKELLN